MSPIPDPTLLPYPPAAVRMNGGAVHTARLMPDDQSLTMPRIHRPRPHVRQQPHVVLRRWQILLMPRDDRAIISPPDECQSS